MGGTPHLTAVIQGDSDPAKPTGWVKDLQRAGITALDALGSKLDSNALRKFLATRMAGSAVPHRLTKEAMHHRNVNLTAQT